MHRIHHHLRNPALVSVGALVFVGIVLGVPGVSMAAKGDCGQPSSTGVGVVTSDAQTILRSAVSLATVCNATPCICDVNASDTITTSDALAVLRVAVGQVVTLQCACMALAGGDDFNDNSADPTKWSEDFINGNGVLDETSHVLEYTCSTSTSYDQSLRDWIASDLPYNSDWEVQIDVVKLAAAADSTELDSFGLSVIDSSNAASEVFAEMYATRSPGPSSGFYSEFYDHDTYIDFADTDNLGVTNGAVRITFTSANKVMHLYYDLNTGNGYTWVEFGSFGVAGSGGATANADWGLGSGDHFLVGVYGYSSNMIISAGQMAADNFVVTGGVAP